MNSNGIHVREGIEAAVRDALRALGVVEPRVALEHPAELAHGDYATNVALVYAKGLKMNPRALAEQIAKGLPAMANVKTVDIAGPGFINFHLDTTFFIQSIIAVAKQGVTPTNFLHGKKIFAEYTQPNPFKEFHIGHMMNNMTGEALSRILAASGAEVKRATYHGDVGMHVAKTIWGLQHMTYDALTIQVLGKAYAAGNNAYEAEEGTVEGGNRADIIALNKKIYTKSDATINTLYDAGRAVSLAHFEELYAKLGSHFEYHFFESESGPRGAEIVRASSVFTKSEGAIIFKGEEHDPTLHTRVFINSEGLPTYEAKEIGLMGLKDAVYKADEMLTVTANEQTDFFRVVKCALELVFPEYKGKLKHVSHGLLKLPSGKMSSRTGTIISAESLIATIEEEVRTKIADRGFDDATSADVVAKVALAAIRYMIIKQAIGSDVIFDISKSVSFEGDSGPYLQYSCVRAKSVVIKARAAGIAGYSDGMPVPSELSGLSALSALEKMLYRYPEVVERAGREYAPHYIATYLVELASLFNNYYANNQIINVADALSPYRVVLVDVFASTLDHGLKLLAIDLPVKM